MEYAVIAIVALLVSGLTLFSGFGLGTLLMPAFALFFPVEVAIAATAVVHAANNVFKVGVVGREADMGIVLRFGVPAVVAAFIGAGALGFVSHLGEIATYTIGSRIAVITPVKLTVGALMFVFALFELLPRLRDLQFDRKHLFAGGALSGFFGGFSGHQGALRAAFLAKVGVTTEAFVGTNAVIGFMVDMVRIAIYAVSFAIIANGSPLEMNQAPLILTGVVAAFCGVLIGKRFVHKVTMKSIQKLMGVLLVAIAIALISGII